MYLVPKILLNNGWSQGLSQELFLGGSFHFLLILPYTFYTTYSVMKVAKTLLEWESLDYI